MTTALHPRAGQILEFILAHQAIYGIAPSLAEIARETRCAASTALHHVQRLRALGHLHATQTATGYVAPPVTLRSLLRQAKGTRRAHLSRPGSRHHTWAGGGVTVTASRDAFGWRVRVTGRAVVDLPAPTPTDTAAALDLCRPNKKGTR